MVVQVVVRFGGHDCDDAVFGGKAVADVVGRERAFFLVFAEAEGIFGGGAEGRAIHNPRLRPTHIIQNQLQGSADRGVGAPALAEAIGAAVDVQCVPQRAVHHDHRGAGMRRRQRAVQVVVGH